MATVSIPSSRQARMTRTAISPRLATRTFLNSFCFMVLTALQRIAGHPRSVAMPLQVDEKGLRAFGPVGALAPRRPIFGLISCAPRSRIIQMRSLRCSEMRPNLDHLDGQLARRPFFINLLGRCLDGRPFKDQLIRVADREVESYEPPEESLWLHKRGACDPDALWTCHRKGRLAAGAKTCLLLGLFNELEGSGIVDHIHHSPYSYAS